MTGPVLVIVLVAAVVVSAGLGYLVGRSGAEYRHGRSERARAAAERKAKAARAEKAAAHRKAKADEAKREIEQAQVRRGVGP